MALDTHNPAVRAYIDWMEEQIEKKRNALERPDKGEVATALARGYIKAMRDNIKHLTGDLNEDDPSSS